MTAPQSPEDFLADIQIDEDDWKDTIAGRARREECCALIRARDAAVQRAALVKAAEQFEQSEIAGLTDTYAEWVVIRQRIGEILRALAAGGGK